MPFPFAPLNFPLAMASPLVQPQPPQPPQLPPSSQLVPSPQLSASLLVTKNLKHWDFREDDGGFGTIMVFPMFDGRFGGIPMNFRHTHLLPATNGDTCIYLSCCQSSTHHSGCILTLDVQHVARTDLTVKHEVVIVPIYPTASIFYPIAYGEFPF